MVQPSIEVVNAGRCIEVVNADRCGHRPDPLDTYSCDRPIGHDGDHEYWVMFARWSDHPPK